MILPKNFDYHVIINKYDGQNLSIKYDRDPPPPSAHSYIFTVYWQNSGMVVSIQLFIVCQSVVFCTTQFY